MRTDPNTLDDALTVDDAIALDRARRLGWLSGGSEAAQRVHRRWCDLHMMPMIHVRHYVTVAPGPERPDEAESEVIFDWRPTERPCPFDLVERAIDLMTLHPIDPPLVHCQDGWILVTAAFFPTAEAERVAFRLTELARESIERITDE